MSTTHDPLRLKTTQSQLNMTQTESTMTDYNLLDNSWTQTEKVENLYAIQKRDARWKAYGFDSSVCCDFPRKKAADTGSLLTHFICLALGLLTMKQMENNCIISRMERLLTGYLFHMQFVEFLPVFSAHAR